ncbi:MAG: hypothetical protein IV100_24330 [Myxococcales bacterium]|nr:hypothetical protein [Myxococcales bacterium]
MTAFTLDGNSGTISGTFSGDINTSCATGEEPVAYTPVEAVFEDVPFTVFAPAGG